MTRIAAVIKSFRLPFLVLTPVCVFLGASVVYASHATFNKFNLVLAMAGALAAHISVNSLNEYLDFKNGLDLQTRRTPFSGGSGALPACPGADRAVLVTAIIFLIISSLIGVFLIQQAGMGLLPLGFMGILLILTYTSWLNQNPFLCLIAPGLGFGVLMVVGTQYVLTAEYIPSIWWVSLAPFLLCNNLLLLNQYPDIEADRHSGRRHLAIVYGVSTANSVYALMLAATAVIIGLGMYLQVFPPQSWLAFLPLPAGIYALSGAIQHGADIGFYPQYMAANVIVTVFTPLLLGMAFMIS